MFQIMLMSILQKIQKQIKPLISLRIAKRNYYDKQLDYFKTNTIKTHGRF